MGRTGKALNLWIPEDAWKHLDHYSVATGTTKTEAVAQAIKLLRVDRREMPASGELEDRVAELEQRLDMTSSDLSDRLSDLSARLESVSDQ